MFEMDTSSLMSGEGKQPAASRFRPSALPRLYARYLPGPPCVKLLARLPIYKVDKDSN